MIKSLFKVNDKDDLFPEDVLKHEENGHFQIHEYTGEEDDAGSKEEMELEIHESSVPLNMLDEKNDIIICAELPNIDIASLKILVKGKIIELSCIKKIDATGNFLVKEIPDGKYARSIKLSDYIDESNSTAAYDNGLLKITLRKLEVDKSKEITLVKK